MAKFKYKYNYSLNVVLKDMLTRDKKRSKSEM